jgi:hypothetical protein
MTIDVPSNAITRSPDMTISTSTESGTNHATASVGGAEIDLTVNVNGELVIDVRVSGELDPEVFEVDAEFGSAKVQFRRNGQTDLRTDLNPRKKA